MKQGQALKDHIVRCTECGVVGSGKYYNTAHISDTSIVIFVQCGTCDQVYQVEYAVSRVTKAED